MSDSGPIRRARQAALKYLTYRPHSEAEIRTRLLKYFPSATVEQVLDNLLRQNLVDDAKFATQWVHSRDAHHPRSSWAIKRELLKKGIDSNVAEKAIEDVNDEETAYRLGMQQAQRMAGVDLQTFRRRLWGYLKRRGFADSLSRKTISRLSDEIRDESD